MSGIARHGSVLRLLAGVAYVATAVAIWEWGDVDDPYWALSWGPALVAGLAIGRIWAAALPVAAIGAMLLSDINQLDEGEPGPAGILIGSAVVALVAVAGALGGLVLHRLGAAIAGGRTFRSGLERRTSRPSWPAS